jgi:hypothetical protein
MSDLGQTEESFGDQENSVNHHPTLLFTLDPSPRNKGKKSEIRTRNAFNGKKTATKKNLCVLRREVMEGVGVEEVRHRFT